jgi:hypothetical protein
MWVDSARDAGIDTHPGDYPPQRFCLDGGSTSTSENRTINSALRGCLQGADYRLG